MSLQIRYLTTSIETQIHESVCELCTEKKTHKHAHLRKESCLFPRWNVFCRSLKFVNDVCERVNVCSNIYIYIYMGVSMKAYTSMEANISKSQTRISDERSYDIIM